ncbi:hypothetical protein Syun_026411 [Stephania yunnanensis]|uniref:Glutaredoxin n=1 Tax=Stephania yunnanensis TaxID=152371 RepID=A0AAP0ETF4_9MAGN
MSHVMRRLLSTLGAHPTVVQLDDSDDHHGVLLGGGGDAGAVAPLPAVYIGGRRVGGLESLMALHLSGELTAMLTQVLHDHNHHYHQGQGVGVASLSSSSSSSS